PTGIRTSHQELLEYLLNHQFLLDDSAPSERSLLEERFHTSLYEAVNFGITFGLTMKCNFSCTYCYQASTMGRMTENTLSRIRNHFLQRIGSFQKFAAVWFGGEPLLHIRQILSMSTFLINECDRHGIPYSADLITNGFLLTPEVVSKLEECRVSDV